MAEMKSMDEREKIYEASLLALHTEATVLLLLTMKGRRECQALTIEWRSRAEYQRDSNHYLLYKNYGISVNHISPVLDGYEELQDVCAANMNIFANCGLKLASQTQNLEHQVIVVCTESEWILANAYSACSFHSWKKRGLTWQNIDWM